MGVPYRIIFMSIFMLSQFSSAARSQVISEELPPELQNIDVIEHLGDSIPLDLHFTNDEGEAVVLGKYFEDGKPAILILAYYECPMLCNLVMNGLSNAVRNLDWVPGEEFRMLTISIDPTENVELASGKKSRYYADFGKTIAKDGWMFFVGDESQSKALADAVGFQYYYDEEKDQYAHPAVIMLISPTGRITRYLYGIEFKERDLKLGLLEASEGKIGTTLDRFLLFCYHYDPDSKGYAIFAGNVMRIGGGVTLLALIIFLGSLWVREQVKQSHKEFLS